MGLPARYAHCLGHRRTEEALLAPGCPKPATKPRRAPFSPPKHISAGVREGIAMAGSERQLGERIRNPHLILTHFYSTEIVVNNV